MIVIIGGPHEGFINRSGTLKAGQRFKIGDSQYLVHRFKTGTIKESRAANIMYAAPIHWDIMRCFKHLLSLVEKDGHRTKQADLP